MFSKLLEKGQPGNNITKQYFYRLNITITLIEHSKIEEVEYKGHNK